MKAYVPVHVEIEHGHDANCEITITIYPVSFCMLVGRQHSDWSHYEMKNRFISRFDTFVAWSVIWDQGASGAGSPAE